MMKKKIRVPGGLAGDQAAVAARQAGLLDAYTESSASTNVSDSDKFKEGYKKKGKKVEKVRKSESEEVIPPIPQEEPKEEVDSWEDKTVESWEDIEAPEMPVPAKVKQEMRKQEKQRKKEQERRGKEGTRRDEAKPAEAEAMAEAEVEKITQNLEKVALEQSNKGKGKADPQATKPTAADGKETTAAKEDPAAVKAEREDKKAAKSAAKNKKGSNAPKGPDATNKEATNAAVKEAEDFKPEPAKADSTKTEEQLRKEAEKAKRKAEFEAKMKAAKAEEGESEAGEKSKADLKAERRAKQEAQRLAKAQAQEQKMKPAVQKVRIPDEVQADQAKAEKKLARVLASQNIPARTKAQRQVPLFSHLHQYEKDNSVTLDLPAVGGNIHPAVIEAGLQFTDGGLGGSDRCSTMLSALESVICDSIAQLKDIQNCDLFKELDSALKPNLLFLKQCRPLSISMSNAVRTIKSKLKTLDRSLSCEDLLAEVKTIFSDYVQENLHLATVQISLTAASKIQNGDVILTYSSSAVVEQLLLVAARDKTFRVIVADGRVHCRGRQIAERLAKAGIDTTYILLTALTQVLPIVTKVFIGCAGVLANGCVLAEVGTSQVALLSNTAGIPVLVCCQTSKFTERVQTDSFVNNELLDPEELVQTGTADRYLENWRDLNSLHLLNLVYDVTPASLISAVITELSVIPTTSVPVILRLKNWDGQLGS